MDILRIESTDPTHAPGRACTLVTGCPLHAREERWDFAVPSRHPTDPTASTGAMLQLAAVTLAACSPDRDAWRRQRDAFRRRFFEHVGEVPLVGIPIAACEGFRTALEESAGLVNGLQTLTAMPIPRHVYGGTRAWVEDAAPDTREEMLVIGPSVVDRDLSHMPAHGRGIWRRCDGRWTLFMTARRLGAFTHGAHVSLIHYLALRTASSCDEYRLRLPPPTRVQVDDPPVLAMVRYRRLGTRLYGAVTPVAEVAASTLDRAGAS